MIIDNTSLLQGFSFGALSSGLFFMGLALGIRIGLRSSRPAMVILLSSVLRISLLLLAGYWTVSIVGNVWSGIGFALAFFLIRLLVAGWTYLVSTSAKPQEEAS